MEKKEMSSKPHVLVLPYPAQGHINPMLQFCKRLVSKGIKATLATTIYISKSMHADPKGAIAIETFSDGFDEGGYGQAESTEAYIAKLREVGSRTLADLIRKLDLMGRPVDALVYDGFVPWGLDVAKQFGLLGAIFFTQSCAVNSLYYHVHMGLLSLPLSESTVSVPGSPVLEPWETPSFLYIYGSHPGFYNVVLNQFSNIANADWVLLNTFYDLEKEVIDWMAKLWRVRNIGPTIPSMYLDKRLEDDTDYGINLFKPESDECLNWLSGKSPCSVVYISFGSMAELEAEQMEELAWGLTRSDYFFLWVVRESEEKKLPRKIFNESDKGLVVTWSPQLEVLAHESVGCFVTHCGFNSVLEAICLGVPIVAMPQWTDQPTNAKYVEDVWGIGLRARQNEKGIVERDVLEVCIRKVMDEENGKEIRKNAKKWKNLAREAVDVGGGSDENIDEFIAALGTPSCIGN